MYRIDKLFFNNQSPMYAIFEKCYGAGNVIDETGRLYYWQQVSREYVRKCNAEKYLNKILGGG